ncbi:hypothetical protein AS19_17090 [Alcanivorax sp. NBRC 101098]|jgi:hypothetical protein|uniref:hypothetical protein n=1 Tax=Alcanivorax sp. NBRC 101098 TaxID=1113728 RepID=UPI0004ABE8F3|nr:hypothetical protein [Alcanivorax sp. NBRC 101098]BAP14560.1 hypothetical protein AS19_17090 [Alcanivorax sp. NBRC 101098]
MLSWIAEHQKSLSVIASFSSVLIWLVYAQLLYLGFRRQRSPRLIINRGRNKDINALCLISNMSAESVFIQYIIAELHTSQGVITMDVTDFEQEYNQGDEDPEKRTHRSGSSSGVMEVTENTRQGPVKPGGFSHIGTFSELVQRLARDEGIEMDGHMPKGDLEFNHIKLRLIGIYGPENKPIGAERGFDLAYNANQFALSPTSWDTKQLVSLRQRHKLHKIVENLNATNFSSSSSFRRVEENGS